MPKQSPHPHVTWRGGRPRFSPGPELRDAGYRGFDLRHGDGSWYSFGEACDWARDFAARLPRRPRSEVRAAPQPAEVVRQTKPPKPPHPRQNGYVYFLWAGDRVKIGFSTDPLSRMRGLLTGVGDPIRRVVVLPGTPALERALHKELSGLRTRGEWFRNSLSVTRVMQREMAAEIERLDWSKPVREKPQSHVERSRTLVHKCST